MEDRIRRLRAIKETARFGGGKEKIARQHKKGKLTARERLERLLDPDSFVETDLLIGANIEAPTDGAIAGHGKIDGRIICIYSQDATVFGGTTGYEHGRKIYETVERAMDMGVPLIALNDSPGARAERMDRPGYFTPMRATKFGGSVFFPHTQASGVIPQISLILGSCAGNPVYYAPLTDFVFMVDGISHMFVTGPRVVKAVMWEEIGMEELGGAKVHCQISGVADFRMKSEDECFQMVRKLLSFLPSNCQEAPPIIDTGDNPNRLDDDLAEILPADVKAPYDMHKIINRLVDNGDFLEVKAEFAGEMIVGFARLDGRPVGIIANQPIVRAGALTADASIKQARFIRFCDAFNIPLILLVDTPAYAPGSHQEHAGIIRHGAKTIYALCEATVPRISVILRKCYGGAQLGMGILPGLGTDFVFAWPTAEVGVMGAKQTVELFFAEDIRKAKNPEEFRAQKVREYQDLYSDPIALASMGIRRIDDVIEPRETRRRLISTLQLLRGKSLFRYPKKHGNIPL